MCQDPVPLLTPEAAADRLAARQDVPELTAGLLDREHEREASHYLKTTPADRTGGFGRPGGLFDPDWPYVPDRPVAEYGRYSALGGYGPLIQGLPEI
jgi:hypothetical protein